VAQISPERIARHALRRARGGSIIIFHDGRDGRGADRAATVQAVQLVVDSLRDQHYDFVTVDQLLGVPAYHGNPTCLA
jgi:peptidoglycan/xylan/chitin deacetylase (PgdA/CDA1 family)